MKYHVSVIFLMISLLITRHCTGQQENIWVFGNKAGVDFNASVPLAIKSEIIGYGEANASICGSDGALLFYTQGFYVYNKQHNVMPNGSNLIPFGSHLFVSSAAQGTIIVPFAEDTNKFYIFSLTAMEAEANKGKLYYSVVDMTLNGGSGDVVADRKGILLDSFLRENMIAIGGNHCNNWLLVQHRDGFVKSFEITSSGINTNPVLSRNSLTAEHTYTYASFAVSPNRKKLSIQNSSLASGIETLSLFDFEPLTGVVQNEMHIDTFRSGILGGACFSPDNLKLYVNGEGGIYQYDLSNYTQGSIIASKTLLGTTAWTQLKLAADGKIYFQNNTGNNPDGNVLGCIPFPNIAGTGAQIIPNAIQLVPATTMRAGLPNRIALPYVDTTRGNRVITAECFSEAIPLVAQDTSGYDYYWDNGFRGKQRDIAASGVYWVGYRLSPCTFRLDTFTVIFQARQPVIQTMSSCQGINNGQAWVERSTDDTVQYRYKWYQPPNQLLSVTDTLDKVYSGTYMLEVLSSTGCSTMATVVIPEVKYQVAFQSDTLLCINDPVSFVNASDDHFSRYIWQFGDGNFSSLHEPVHNYPLPGKYRATLIGIGPVCTDTMYKDVTVDQPVDDLFLNIFPREVCAGEEVNFHLSGLNHTAVKVKWLMGNGMLYLEEEVRSRYRHAYDQPGNIPVALTLALRACPAITLEDSVLVHSFPEVDLGKDSSLCFRGQPLHLHNLAGRPQPEYRYLWSTGDTTETISVAHPGQYMLSVIAEPLGCTTTESIVVTKDCYIDIPNSFTPNGDGINDYFFPTGVLSSGLISFNMTILNRWGQVIFKTTKPDSRGWDGKFNQQDQPLGAYIYIIDIVFANRQKEQYQGMVTLIR